MPDRFRFQKAYGVPAGRPEIGTKSLESLYRIEKVLDSGGHDPQAVGALNNGVLLVRNRQSGKLRVQKCIPTQSSKVDSSMLQREILMLQVLRHQNVVGYVDACITDGVPRQMSLYMEYCDLGSLQKLIKRYLQNDEYIPAELCCGCQQQSPSRVSAPESFVWHVLHSLASALQYLHYGIGGNDHRDPPEPKGPSEWPPILHRDIKPDNILLRTAPGALSSSKYPSGPLIYPHWPYNKKDPESGDQTYPKIVLADFGIATQYHEPDFHNPDGFIGTPLFSPPEVPKTSGRGDVWALGASVLSLCRLLLDGPVCGPPAHHPDPRGWIMGPECRRKVAHIGPGPGYSSELELVLRGSLRFNTADRLSSWRLMKAVRLAEETVLLPEGKGLVVRPLPGWAYGT